MAKLSLVIFDLDDTLIHSNIDYGKMKERVKNLLDSNYKFSGNLTVKELLDKLSSNPAKLKEGYSIIQSMESESATKAEVIPFAEKIPELLKDLGIKSAILTNNSKESVNKYLSYEKFHFLQALGPITTRDDVTGMKPDPAGLNKIILSFNLQDEKEKVLFIGDSFIDADAAMRAGIRFLLFNYRKLDVTSFKSVPWKAISQLSEIVPILRNEMIDCVF